MYQLEKTETWELERVISRQQHAKKKRLPAIASRAVREKATKG